MLISAVVLCGSVILIDAFLFIFFPIMVYCRILNIIPCVILWYLVVYPSCI